MADEESLLDTKQMAHFVVDGYLRFDNLVPDKSNRAVLAEMQDGIARARAGARLNAIWENEAIGEVFRLPEIQGMIHSLVGPDPLYDHHAVHKKRYPATFKTAAAATPTTIPATPPAGVAFLVNIPKSSSANRAP